jgi:hypothetical protein
VDPPLGSVARPFPRVTRSTLRAPGYAGPVRSAASCPSAERFPARRAPLGALATVRGGASCHVTGAVSAWQETHVGPSVGRESSATVVRLVLRRWPSVWIARPGPASTGTGRRSRACNPPGADLGPTAGGVPRSAPPAVGWHAGRAERSLSTGRDRVRTEDIVARAEIGTWDVTASRPARTRWTGDRRLHLRAADVGGTVRGGPWSDGSAPHVGAGRWGRLRRRIE